MKTQMLNQSKSRYTLWHRSNRSERWKPLATANTTAELVAQMAVSGPGEYLDLATGLDPNRGTTIASIRRRSL